MKILHLSSEYPPQAVYGLGRYVNELAEAQAHLGHTVEVIANSYSGSDDGVVRNGVLVSRVHFPPPPKAPSVSSMLLHFNLQVMERYVELHHGSSEPFDVINAHDWLTFPAAFHLSRLAKRPLVTTIHDVIFNKVRGRAFGDEDSYIAGIENWATHCSSRIVVLSKTVRDEVLHSYSGTSDNVCVIPGGVGIEPVRRQDAVEFVRWREKTLSNNDYLLLFVGRLEPEKGLDTLLEATRMLKTRRAKGWKLLIAGTGRLTEFLNDYIRKNGLSDCVRLIGYLPFSDLRTAYAVADITIVPSEYEPFGLVALESQRMGTPVIAASTGGLAETIAQTQGGLTFRPGDAVSLAACIENLLADESLCADLGRTGQKRVGMLFNWTGIAKSLSEQYSNIRNAPRPECVDLPMWKYPNARPVGQIQLPPQRAKSTDQLSDLTVIWDAARIMEVKPVLDALSRSHALSVLGGSIHVVQLVLDRNVIVSHPGFSVAQFVRFIVMKSSDDLAHLIRNSAAVIVDATAAVTMQSAGCLDPAKIPVIWFGAANSKNKLDWYFDNLSDLYAIGTKLLCDERLREKLSGCLEYRIPQVSTQQAEQSKSLVLHVVPQLVTGGAETTLLELIKGTQSLYRHEIMSLALLEGPLPEEFSQLGVLIHDMTHSDSEEIAVFIGALNPGLIHLHSMSYLARWIPVHRRLSKFAIVETEHVVNIGSGHFGPVDQVVCVSQATLNAHGPYKGCFREYCSKFSVIYNGIEIAEFADLPSQAEVREQLNLPLDRPIVGRVSALARNKLPQEALDIIPLVLKRVPSALFVIVGDGAMRTTAEEWVRTNGLVSNVRFLGERRDIPKVLKAFDVFAYYTTKDALGNVILEAVAAGIPVVTTDVEGTREAMGEAPGSLVPLNDLDAFASETAKWLTNKTTHAEYRLNERFSRKSMSKSYLSLYDQLRNSRAHSRTGKPDESECVTVLIPVFNPDMNWFREALNSVRRQSYTNWKIVIVDDGSTQESASEMQIAIRDELHLQDKCKMIALSSNQGVAIALNTGLAAIDTELVARLDADDRMNPERLMRQFEFMRANPKVSVLGTCARGIGARGDMLRQGPPRLMYPTEHNHIVNAFSSYCALAHPSVIFRKRDVIAAGGYDPESAHYEDYELWVRMAAQGYRFGNLTEELIDYRIHEGSVSRTYREKQLEGTEKCKLKAAKLILKIADV